MRDRPIIMQPESVRGILREIREPGTGKTQTRRALNLPAKTDSGRPIYERPDMGGWAATTVGGDGVFTRGGKKRPAPGQIAIWHQTCGTCVVAPYQVGDRLWVREPWRTDSKEHDKLSPIDLPIDSTILFEADRAWSDNRTVGRLRAAMHMPRAYSRLTLVVTDVRIERLQQITEDDAEAEGVDYNEVVRGRRVWHGRYRAAYRALWDRINGERAGGRFAWDENPFVAALTFQPHLRNIAKMPEVAS